MKLAITDACIFIDLFDLDLMPQLFALNFEFHTSCDVINELDENHQQLISEYVLLGKLIKHIITQNEKHEIYCLNFPISLSESDKSVLYLGIKLDATILSSDKVVRNSANKNIIKYHGIIWLFDKMIENNVISKSFASIKIKQLITTNIVYQNNIELKETMKNRLQQWSND